MARVSQISSKVRLVCPLSIILVLSCLVLSPLVKLFYVGTPPSSFISISFSCPHALFPPLAFSFIRFPPLSSSFFLFLPLPLTLFVLFWSLLFLAPSFLLWLAVSLSLFFFLALSLSPPFSHSPPSSMAILAPSHPAFYFHTASCTHTLVLYLFLFVFYLV